MILHVVKCPALVRKSNVYNTCVQYKQADLRRVLNVFNNNNNDSVVSCHQRLLGHFRNHTTTTIQSFSTVSSSGSALYTVLKSDREDIWHAQQLSTVSQTGRQAIKITSLHTGCRIIRICANAG